MAGPMLLCYNLDERTSSKLRALCEAQQIRFREVGPDAYSLPLGALAGIPAIAVSIAHAAPFDDPMLVMCHMLSPQLDAFLRGMRESGIRPIGLKAVLTPTNVAWNSRQLRDELAKEHEAMRKGR